MILAYAHGGDLLGAVLLLLATVACGLAAARARHREVELNRARRVYPCSHGATGTARWPDRRA